MISYMLYAAAPVIPVVNPHFYSNMPSWLAIVMLVIYSASVIFAVYALIKITKIFKKDKY